MSSRRRGSWWAFTPMRTPDRRGPTALPNSSATQISPDCSGDRSKPTSQKASMHVGSGPALSTASTSPSDGVYRRRSACALSTTRSSRWRCCPTADPAGPEKVPVWRFDTRSSPSASRQAGWSASIRSRRTPGSSSYRAAERSGVVHCGR